LQSARGRPAPGGARGAGAGIASGARGVSGKAGSGARPRRRATPAGSGRAAKTGRHPRDARAPAGRRASAAPGVAVTNANVGRVFAILRRAAPSWNAPVVTLISTHSRDPFKTLTSCILSLRTKDEVTAHASRRMFALADSAEKMAEVDEDVLARAIFPVGFYRTKARTLREIARQLLERFAGRVPDDIDALLTLPGVGRKTANLVVAQAYGKPGICVDTHVHRITNRWGYVHTRTPEQTEMALRAKLPRRHWLEINDLLVAFGQTLCQPVSPRCSICPIARDCPRIGVVHSR
jgi:endonuclease-3